jgi:hypothetical protein
MRVGDKAMFYPASECDQGVMAEVNRCGCAATCVHQHQDGRVNLVVWDHGGNRHTRENVRVLSPPLTGEAVDDPHGEPYCRPAE